jgi:hypothetical protein
MRFWREGRAAEANTVARARNRAVKIASGGLIDTVAPRARWPAARLTRTSDNSKMLGALRTAARRDPGVHR